MRLQVAIVTDYRSQLSRTGIIDVGFWETGESVNQNRYYVNKTSKQADWP